MLNLQEKMWWHHQLQKWDYQIKHNIIFSDNEENKLKISKIYYEINEYNTKKMDFIKINCINLKLVKIYSYTLWDLKK